MKSRSKLNDIKAFDICIAAILSVIGLLVLYPLWFVVIASISDPTAVSGGKLFLWPVGIDFDGYKYAFSNNDLWIGYRNTIIYTVSGTILNIVVTMMGAYVLTCKELIGRKWLNWFVVIPMWFGGGLIPTYLVMDSIGLVGNPLILILLGLVSPYNLIVARTFVGGLPNELREAAKIDGASDFQIFRIVILPLSSAILAVLVLYYGVAHWNGYFNAMIYIDNDAYQVLQVYLRKLLMLTNSVDFNSMDAEELIEMTKRAESMKYAVIILASAPLLILYPMLQKYFAKGVLIGSIKG